MVLKSETHCKILYVDFEYRDYSPVKRRLLSAQVCDGDGLAVFFDMRQSITDFMEFFNNNANQIWCGFGSAEMLCFNYLGIDTRQVKYIDLMAESWMLKSNTLKWSEAGCSLVNMLSAYGVEIGKQQSRKSEFHVLLANIGNVLSEKAWESNLEAKWDLVRQYGMEDVLKLPELLHAVLDTHKQLKTNASIEDMVKRGEYITHTTYTDHKTKGFRVNEPWIRDIIKNKSNITLLIQKNLNNKLNTPIYSGFSKKTEAKILDRKCLNKWVNSNRFFNWEKTKTGNYYSSDSKVLQKVRDIYPEVEPFYQAQKSINTLRTVQQLEGLIYDSHIKSNTFAYRAATSRNGPKPTEGFILGMPHWLRMMIAPENNEVLLAADWSSQEVAVAAALSGDDMLWKVYDSGDVYLGLAVLAGAIKEPVYNEYGLIPEQKTIRDLFKSLQLGISYGMGRESLFSSMYYVLKKQGVSQFQAKRRANKLYAWHKRVFRKYWKWAEKVRVHSLATRTFVLKDGWVIYQDPKKLKHKLVNALLNAPMQGNGAVIMRRASILMAKANLDVICSQHDAFYVATTEKCKEQDKSAMLECMESAVSDILGEKFKIRVDVHEISKNHSYLNLLAKPHLEQYHNVCDLLGDHIDLPDDPLNTTPLTNLIHSLKNPQLYLLNRL